MLKRVHDPQRYGVGRDARRPCHRHRRKTGAAEKRLCRLRNLCLSAGRVRRDPAPLPSQRGELEITDVNRHYLEQGRLEYAILEGYWTDAGTLESWSQANRLVHDQPPIF